MIVTYAIIGLSLAWMFWELKTWLRYGIIIGAIQTLCPAMESIEALIKAREHLDNLILCRNCRYRYISGCRKLGDKDRWFAHTIPAKTITAFNHTFNWLEGCNIKRAEMLKAVVKAQKHSAPASYPRPSARGYEHYGDDEITISVTGGKSITVNGNYKKGMIKDFMKASKLTKIVPGEVPE